MTTPRQGITPVPAPEPEPEPGPTEQVETALVVAAVAQGVLVGGWLTLLPDLALRAGGFPAAPAFFVRFAGVLHLVLALGYALDWTRSRRVTLLVTAKAATALFLIAAWIGDGLPGLLVGAVALEATMSLCGILVHPHAERSRRARARLRLVGAATARVRAAGRP
jgi:hypothetical protein